MEKFNNLVKDANNKFRTADHLIYVTYNLVKDKKLMLSIVQSLHSAALSGVAALLYYEKLYKRINIFPLDADSRIKIFENQVAQNHNLNSDIIKVVKELRLVVEEHRESPLEFARKERLIICNNNYSKVNIIDIQKLKHYASNIRKLINVINGLENV